MEKPGTPWTDQGQVLGHLRRDEKSLFSREETLQLPPTQPGPTGSSSGCTRTSAQPHLHRRPRGPWLPSTVTEIDRYPGEGRRGRAEQAAPACTHTTASTGTGSITAGFLLTACPSFPASLSFPGRQEPSFLVHCYILMDAGPFLDRAGSLWVYAGRMNESLGD